MPAESGHLRLQRLEDLVEFAGALNTENADVGPLADGTPKMEPLALTLKVGGALVLQLTKSLDLSGISSLRGPDGDEDVELQG